MMTLGEAACGLFCPMFGEVDDVSGSKRSILQCGNGVADRRVRDTECKRAGLEKFAEEVKCADVRCGIFRRPRILLV